MKLREYLAGMEAAQTIKELEDAIQAPYEHPFRGPTWSRICKARIAAGHRICDADPHGDCVPRVGPRRKLVVCGQTYGVGYGQNGAGERYVWHDAEQFAKRVLVEKGFGLAAAHAIWDWSFQYPHRALRSVHAALEGKIPDPEFNTLIRGHDSPLRKGVRVLNREEEGQRRAHQPCKCDGCDGWLWDWGCGWNGYANVLNWRCDRCPALFVEYVADARLREIRNPQKEAHG